MLGLPKSMLRQLKRVKSQPRRSVDANRSNSRTTPLISWCVCSAGRTTKFVEQTVDDTTTYN
jgi:hypothetical protein